MGTIRRGTAFLLVLAVLTGFCLPAAADTAATAPGLTAGVYDGYLYRNSFLDIGFRVRDWHCYDSAELAAYNQLTAVLLPEDIGELVRQKQSLVLMCADSPDGLASVNIAATYVPGFGAAAEELGMQTVAEMSLDSVRNVQKSLGRPDVSVSVVSDRISGETFWGYQVSFTYMGMQFYQRQILLAADDYSVALTATALSAGETMEMIGRFYRISGEREFAPFSPELRPGDIVSYGRYDQDGDRDSGKEEIEWTVLDVQEDRALLLSVHTLDAVTYNGNDRYDEDLTWETCALRGWLNSTFLTEAFSPDEEAAVICADVPNGPSQGNPKWDTDGGNDTQDRAFALSAAESEQFFADDAARLCSPTDRALARNAFANSLGNGSWWLRSPGGYQYCAAMIGPGGNLVSMSTDNGGVGVRPAIWVPLGF